MRTEDLPCREDGWRSYITSAVRGRETNSRRPTVTATASQYQLRTSVVRRRIRFKFSPSAKQCKITSRLEYCIIKQGLL